MNILEVGTGGVRIPPRNYGGTELHIFSVSRELARAGHCVTVVDIKEPGDPDTEQISGVRFVRLPAGKRRGQSSLTLGLLLSMANSVAFAVRVSRYIKKDRFDAVHVSGTLVGLVLTFLNPRLRRKMVYSAYSPIWFMPSPGWWDRLSRAADYHLMRRVGAVIVQTESFRSRLAARGIQAAVIHTAVATEEFGAGVATSGVISKYGLAGRTTVLFNGRIVPYKGVEYLVKAARIVTGGSRHPEVLFLLVGPLAEHGLDRAAYYSYISRVFGLIREAGLEPRVRLTGALPFAEVVQLFAACDIFVLPSLAESSPLVVAQAMASAKPVVGTRVGGVPDQVRDGWNGFLLEPADEKELAEKIEYLIGHPEERRRMGLNGRRLAEDEFSWSRITEQTLRVYHRVTRG